MVSTIREETRQAVDNMQTTVTSVDRSVEMTQHAVNRITEIQKSMEEVVSRMGEIAHATNEQRNAATSIAQSTERINNRIVESDEKMQKAYDMLAGLSNIVSNMRQLFARFHL